MTPTPPEGFKIIPRAYLEAGNPLPGDGLFTCSAGNWVPSMYRGYPVGELASLNDGDFYATAQPLPCFQKGGDEPCAPKLISESSGLIPNSSNKSASNAPVAVPSPDQGPEHNPFPWDLLPSLPEPDEKLAKLRATIETLTRERDEARAETLKAEADALQEQEWRAQAQTQLAASEKDREKCGRALRLWAKFFGPSHVVKCDEEDRLTVQRAHDEALAAIDAAMKEAK